MSEQKDFVYYKVRYHYRGSSTISTLEKVVDANSSCGVAKHNGVYSPVLYYGLDSSNKVILGLPASSSSSSVTMRDTVIAEGQSYAGMGDIYIESNGNVLPTLVTLTRANYSYSVRSSDAALGSISTGGGNSGYKYNGVTAQGFSPTGTSSTATPNTGCSFIGWFVDGVQVTATSGDVHVGSSNPKTLYVNAEYDVSAEARFQKDEYVCTVYDGVDETASVLTYEGMRYNETPPSITPPTKTGYTFNGIFGIQNGGQMPPPPLPISNGNPLWDASGAPQRVWPSASNLNFMSSWAAKTYNLNIYPCGGTWIDGGSGDPRTFQNYRPVFGSTTANDMSAYMCTKGYDSFLGFFTAASGGDQVYDADGMFVAGSYWSADGKWKYDGEAPINLYAQYGSRHSMTLQVEASFADRAAGASLPETCTVALTSPAVSSDGHYADGTSFTASITSAPGWKAIAVHYKEGELDRGTTQFADEVDSFTFGGSAFNYDLIAIVTFARVEYDVTVGKHSSSTDAVDGVSATVNGSPVTKAKVGDEVTFTATMETGWTFDGWYDAETGGSRVSDAASYTATISGNVALYARAKVAVVFAIDYPSGTADVGKTCSLAVNGTTLISTEQVGPSTVNVPLGDSVSYELTVGTRPNTESLWGFDGWFSNDSVVSLPLTGTFTPAADVSYTAKFVEDATKKVQVVVLVHVGTGENERLSTADAEALLAFTENVRAPIPTSAEVSGDGGSLPTSTDAGLVEKTVNGTQYINISAATSYTDVESGNVYRFNSFAKEFDHGDGHGMDEDLPGADDILSQNPSYTFLVNEDKTVANHKAIYIFYGAPIPVTTYLDRAGGDETWGDFEIVEVTSDAEGTTPDTDAHSISADKHSATALQGKYLVVRAAARNGYRFVGWFWDAQSMGDPDYADAEAVVEVTGQTPLYARFEQDRHSICEWEGSTRNKQMEWRSKTYSAPQPFNPAGCRVDATGYRPETSLTLSVEMFSSPDAAPTATATLDNIASQDARRLPIRRRERFMQVCVKSDAEVDGIFMATSMGGLAT